MKRLFSYRLRFIAPFFHTFTLFIVLCATLRAQVDTRNWMAQLDSSTSLSQISLPGTHETCANLQDYNSKCQTLSLKEQLQLGIRYIDIRCRHKDNKFYIHHGSAYMNMNFDDVMKICTTFLQQNPSEFIVMLVNEEYTPENNTRSFEATFKARYIQPYRAYWRFDPTIPTVQDVRNKIVLLRRFPSTSDTTYPNLGIDVTYWPDNNKGFLTDHSNIHVQDEYSYLTTVPDLREKKWTVLKSGLDTALADNTQRLYINYSSASANIAEAPTRFAETINSYLLSYLQNMSYPINRGIGVIAMDYPEMPDNKLIQTIIRLNQLKENTLPAVIIPWIGKEVRIQPTKQGNPICYWEVVDSGKKTGDQIQLWNTQGAQTKWVFEKHNSVPGAIRIRNVNAGKYVGATGSQAGEGVKCCLVDKTDISSTLFVSESPYQAGTITIWSAGTPKIPIECQNGNLGNSTKIQFWNTRLKRISWKLTAAK